MGLDPRSRSTGIFKKTTARIGKGHDQSCLDSHALDFLHAVMSVSADTHLGQAANLVDCVVNDGTSRVSHSLD